MRNRLLMAVIAAAMSLHPVAAHALASVRGVSSTDGAYLVVEQLLMNRGRLALSVGQVSELTALEDRLRHDRGHREVTGYDRVPGKSVPRVERIRPTSGDARRLAFRALTAEQRQIADTILEHSERMATAQR